MAAGFVLNIEVKAIRPNIGSRVTGRAVGLAEIGNGLVIGNKPAQEPNRLKITIGRGCQAFKDAVDPAGGSFKFARIREDGVTGAAAPAFAGACRCRRKGRPLVPLAFRRRFFAERCGGG